MPHVPQLIPDFQPDVDTRLSRFPREPYRIVVEDLVASHLKEKRGQTAKVCKEW